MAQKKDDYQVNRAKYVFYGPEHYRNAASDKVSLMGRNEVAEFCGITVDAVKKLRQRGKMPDPDFFVSGHPLWLSTTITYWQATRQRRGLKRVKENLL